MDNVKEKLQEVFRDVFDDDDINIFDEMTANDIDEWDSLTHIQLIVACEKEFGCKFKTTEIIDLKNVGEFIALLKSKI